MSIYLARDDSWELGYRTIGFILCFLVAILIITLPLWNKIKTVNENKKVQGIPYRELFRIPGLINILLVFYSFVSFQIIIVLFGSSFLVLEKNILAGKAAQCISLLFIGITLGRFLCGFISFKFSNRQLIRFGFVISACAIILLALPLDNVFLMPIFCLLGFGCAPVFPCVLHDTPKNFGSDKSQAIMGIQMASIFVGPLLTLPLFGAVSAFTGFRIFPLFTGVLLLITIYLFELFNKKIDKTNF
jgi:fucose permease